MGPPAWPGYPSSNHPTTGSILQLPNEDCNIFPGKDFRTGSLRDEHARSVGSRFHVTGGAGFIGSHLVEALFEEGRPQRMPGRDRDPHATTPFTLRPEILRPSTISAAGAVGRTRYPETPSSRPRSATAPRPARFGLNSTPDRYCLRLPSHKPQMNPAEAPNIAASVA